MPWKRKRLDTLEWLPVSFRYSGQVLADGSECPETYLSWQYMHEGYRVSTLLVLHAFVLETPPHATQVRLLVRQALSLLESMYEQNLPGFCSAHFIIFTAAICSVSDDIVTAHTDKMTDRKRAERLYENTM